MLSSRAPTPPEAAEAACSVAASSAARSCGPKSLAETISSEYVWIAVAAARRSVREPIRESEAGAGAGWVC
ncbi:hypothetical protein AB1Y20_007292 [Prymnesium parvum]|uniref:Uncharacterized protein n=1 Tax=Prymnesium parvum TaxID=97485 RepID=A0AB34IUV8_PRYPA